MNPNPADIAEDPVWVDRGLYAEVEERRQQTIRARPNMNGVIPSNRSASCINPDNTKNNPTKKNKQNPKTPNVCPLKIKSNNDNSNPQTPTTPTQTPNEDTSLPTSTKENKAKDGNVKNKVEKKKRDKKNKDKLEAMTALPSASGGAKIAAPIALASVASTSSTDLNERVSLLERENEELRLSIQSLQDKLSRIDELEKSVDQLIAQVDLADKSKTVSETALASGSAEDDVDLFGSDSEDDEEASKIREQRLKAYQDKKSAKPALVAKSSIIFDVKPWDDETNMANLEAAVRTIQMDGLLWGASKLVPLAYGIHKLQINSVIEDEKISVDQLQETIESFEDYVQSVDIFAFNKI